MVVRSSIENSNVKHFVLLKLKHYNVVDKIHWFAPLYICVLKKKKIEMNESCYKKCGGWNITCTVYLYIISFCFLVESSISNHCASWYIRSYVWGYSLPFTSLPCSGLNYILQVSYTTLDDVYCLWPFIISIRDVVSEPCVTLNTTLLTV